MRSPTDHVNQTLTTELDRRLEQLELTAARETTRTAFYSRLCADSLPLLGAERGTLYHDQAGRLECLGQWTASGSAGHTASQASDAARNALSTNQPVTGPDSDGGWRMACPIRLAGRAWGVLAYAWNPPASVGDPETALAIGEAFTETAGLFELHFDRRQLRSESGRWTHYQQFARAAQLETDWRDVALQLANDSQDFLGCDRVSVSLERNRRQRIVAVSGISSMHRRGDLPMRLEKLLTVVGRLGETISLTGTTDTEYPPEILEAWSRYQDVSGDQSLTIVPLKDPLHQESPQPATLGAIAVSFLQTEPQQSFRQDLQLVSDQAAISLAHALRLRGLGPLVTLAGYLFSNRRTATYRTARLLIVVSLLLAIVALPLLVQDDLFITARGRLRPTVEQNVYAPYDGIVEQLNVGHDAKVQPDQVLLTLRSLDLDLEQQRISGELLTAQEQLHSLRAGRLTGRPGQEESEGTSTIRAAQLSSDEQELTVRAAALEQELAILMEQRALLQVCSPCAGSIMTWAPERNLRSRPVQRGQHLLSVGDLEGSWQIDLEISDRRIGHVLRANSDGRPRNEVRFVTASQPEIVHTGTISRIAHSTSTREPDGAYVAATVAFEAEQVPDRRPGAEVVARVHCGRHSLAYIWLHEFIEELLRRFF